MESVKDSFIGGRLGPLRVGYGQMRVVGKALVERRRNHRAKLAPITLVVDGRTYETTEWTLGGFLLDAYADSHRRGDVATVVIKVDAGGGKLYEHQARAVVARVDKERGQLAAKFIELDGAAIGTLEGWFTGRLRRRAGRRKRA